VSLCQASAKPLAHESNHPALASCDVLSLSFPLPLHTTRLPHQPSRAAIANIATRQQHVNPRRANPPPRRRTPRFARPTSPTLFSLPSRPVKLGSAQRSTFPSSIREYLSAITSAPTPHRKHHHHLASGRGRVFSSPLIRLP